MDSRLELFESMVQGSKQGKQESKQINKRSCMAIFNFQAFTYAECFLRVSPCVAVTRDCLEERRRFIFGPSESKTAARL